MIGKSIFVDERPATRGQGVLSSPLAPHAAAGGTKLARLAEAAAARGERGVSGGAGGKG